MQAPRLILLFFILFVSCQGNDPNVVTTADRESKITPQANDTVIETPGIMPSDTALNKLKLALTSNAVQLVDAVTGSTKEISFGMPYEQLVAITGRILEGKPISVGVNSECGAGPLKMATWPNGLTLVFMEKKRGSSEWLFAGWFAGKPTGKGDKPTTMAGVGVGSTLEELESAYVTTITKTTLGQEFSIKQGFYGILSGTGKKATIDVIWSGTSCNFR
ncbi:MAG: hypothetical protein ABIT96_09865 [Ferruginibacter sp.]